MNDTFENMPSGLTSSSTEPSLPMPKDSSPLIKWGKRTISAKTLFIIALVLAAAALAYHFKGLLIAATVNGLPISRLAVIEQLERTAGKTTLETMINQKLIDGEAQKRSITVSEDEINAQMKTVEDQIVAQGATLAQALADQGMTQAEFKKWTITQLELEKLLADQMQVTDAEIAQYIKDSGQTVPAGQEATYQSQAKDALQQQKLSDAAGPFMDSLRAQSSIHYFVNY